MPKATSVSTRSAKDIDTLIGKRVREIRKQKGMTQSELGDAVGVAFQQIQKYEKATNRISASTLYAICQYFDYPIEKMFDASETNSPRHGKR